MALQPRQLALCLRHCRLRLLNQHLRLQGVDPRVLTRLHAAHQILRQSICFQKLALVQVQLNLGCGCAGGKCPQLASQLEFGQRKLAVKTQPLGSNVGLGGSTNTAIPKRQLNFSFKFTKAIIFIEPVSALR